MATSLLFAKVAISTCARLQLFVPESPGELTVGRQLALNLIGVRLLRGPPHPACLQARFPERRPEDEFAQCFPLAADRSAAAIDEPAEAWAKLSVDYANDPHLNLTIGLGSLEFVLERQPGR